MDIREEIERRLLRWKLEGGNKTGKELAEEIDTLEREMIAKWLEDKAIVWLKFNGKNSDLVASAIAQLAAELRQEGV